MPPKMTRATSSPSGRARLVLLRGGVTGSLSGARGRGGGSARGGSSGASWPVPRPVVSPVQSLLGSCSLGAAAVRWFALGPSLWSENSRAVGLAGSRGSLRHYHPFGHLDSVLRRSLDEPLAPPRRPTRRALTTDKKARCVSSRSSMAVRGANGGGQPDKTGRRCWRVRVRLRRSRRTPAASLSWCVSSRSSTD
jgi:hypothetical protein